MKARYISLIAMSTLIGAGFAGNAALALTEQSEATLEFTFAPSLTLSVSDSDLIIENLMPGTSDISNTVDVTVTTNALYGYVLSATTGNTTNPTRNLVKDSLNFLESIAADSSTATLGNDTWGYTIDGGITYSGLPLYTDASKELNSSYEPVNATTGKTTFAIGAKASATKASGNYNNVVNFTAVSRAVLPTLQSYTTATCPTTRTMAIDSRDGKKYYIQKITTGETALCWMTTNLNIAGGTTLTSEESNVASNYTLPDSSTAGFNSNSVAHVYNDNTYGGYYNYVAATAGTNPGTGDSTYDICPKGWHLPSKDNYDALKSTYTSKAALAAAPWYSVFGGVRRYGAGSGVGAGGYYWSSTAITNGWGPVEAYWIGIGNSEVNTGSTSRADGASVRCVAAQ